MMGQKLPRQGKWSCKIVGQRYQNLGLLIKMTSQSSKGTNLNQYFIIYLIVFIPALQA